MIPPDQSEDGQAGQAGSKLVEPRQQPASEPLRQPDPVGLPASAALGRLTGSAGLRKLLGSPYLQGLLALLIYTATWLAAQPWQLLTKANWAQLDQRSMDPNFYIWCLRWWPWAIGHGVNPLYTHVIGVPAGFSLAWVTTIPPLALAAAPITVAAGPAVSFNILIAVSIPVAGWAAFLVCRRLTGKFWPSLIGGLIFGLSAYEMNHTAAGQLNLTFSMMVPIMAYVVVLWRDKSIGSRTFVILLGVSMAVQFYLFLETFADLTALLIISLVLGYLIGGRENRPQVKRLSLYVGLSYVLALVLASPYLLYALSSKPPNLVDTSGLDLVSLVVPRPHRAFGLSWLERLALHQIPPSDAGYIGIPLLIMAIVLAVTTWSSRFTRFLTCMLALIIIAALGRALYVDSHRIVTLPWAPLWDLPILRNAFPSRLMLFAYLVLAVAGAVWLARTSPQQWERWIRWPIAALIVVAAITDIPSFGYTGQSSVPHYITFAQYKQDLRPGETVAIVSTIGNAGMLWQAEANNYMKLSGGFVNQAITRRSDLPWQIQDLAHATPMGVREFEAYVRNSGLGAVLLDQRHEPQWVGIFNRIGLRSQSRGGVIVIRTNGCRSCKVLGWAQLRGTPARQSA